MAASSLPPHLQVSSASPSKQVAARYSSSDDELEDDTSHYASISGIVDNSSSSSSSSSISSAAIGCHLGNTQGTQDICIRRYVVEITGSMQQLCNKMARRKLISCSSDLHEFKYRRGACSEPGDARTGDPRRAVIHKVMVNGTNSTFPVNLLLKSNGWSGNLYSKKRGFFSVFADEGATRYKKPILVHTAHSSTYDSKMEKYGAVTEKDLTAVEYEGKYMVKKTNPIYRVLLANQQDFGYTIEDYSETSIKIEKQWYDEARNALMKKVISKQYYTDMTKLDVRVARPDCKWSAAIATLSDLSGESKAAIWRKPCSLTVELTIAFHC